VSCLNVLWVRLLCIVLMFMGGWLCRLSIGMRVNMFYYRFVRFRFICMVLVFESLKLLCIVIMVRFIVSSRNLLR